MAHALSKFDGYLGADVEPDDFDAFWEARMAEADAVPLEWRIEPAGLSSSACEYFDLWFCGMGGARLYAKFLQPRTVGPHPIVLQFHGYPGSSRSWFEQSSFAGMGCALIALDNPGQGGRSQDVGGFVGTTVAGHLVAGADGPPERLYYVRLYQDLRILCRVVRELGRQGLVDPSRVFVNGASQGGGMGIACCALNPELVARAAILYPFLSDFRRVSELNADEVAYEGLRYWSRWFDPDGEHSASLFDKLAYVDTKNFARRVRCPVLFGTGLADTICPPQTQCAVWNALGAPRLRLLFAGRGHEEIAGFDDQILRFFGEALEGSDAGPQCAASDPHPMRLDGSTRLWRFSPGGFGRLDLGNRHARYELVSVKALDGEALSARLVCPCTDGPHPLILLFSDLGREPRGWHHLTRYVGAGFAVLHAENRPGLAADATSLARAVADAEVVAALAVGADWADSRRIISFGEGFGGAVALALAARGAKAPRVCAAAALNPYPADTVAAHGAHVACSVLLGSSGMDGLSPQAAQDELAKALPSVVQKRYPKYEHERINAFEDEFLRFITDLSVRPRLTWGP